MNAILQKAGVEPVKNQTDLLELAFNIGQQTKENKILVDATVQLKKALEEQLRYGEEQRQRIQAMDRQMGELKQQNAALRGQVQKQMDELRERLTTQQEELRTMGTRILASQE